MRAIGSHALGARAGRLALWLALAVAGPATAAPASWAAPETVAAGPLRVDVQSDPWALRFVDRGGEEVLTELDATGLGPSGRLGFRAAGQWFHATRAMAVRRRGRGLEATVATSHPLGRTLLVRVTPVARGVLRVSAAGPTDAEGMGIAFASRQGERFLGFGERSNAVDQRGNEVENYVAEGPYQPEEEPFVAAFVPPPGYRPREDATYFPIPWLLSSRGYGVLLEGDDTSRFRLGSDRDDAWSMEIESERISFKVYAGPRPAGALRRFSADVGRQPRAAAPFYFGPWWQPPGDEDPAKEDASLRTLQEARAIGSVVQTYTHYLPCQEQAGRGNAERLRTRKFHRAGLAVTTYFNPMICTSYQPRYSQAAERRLLTMRPDGRPYEYRYTGSELFYVAQFDFSNPEAVRFYGDLLDEAVRDGYDGWMEDFGEYTPLDARSHDGTPGPEMHNLYPVLYHRAARLYAKKRAPRPLARFNRSGWTGAARFSQIVWGGDPTTDWDFDGLASAVKNGLTMGLSGVSLWGSDIGGFFALSRRQTTPELMRRWLQFGFASGVMRTQANGFTLRPSRRAQIFDPDVLPVWRRYARLRTQLYPYLSAAQREYDRTGLPMMRHLALAYPDDEEAVAREDEYLFGPDLLVAPVLEPDATTREAYLPEGRWIDLWRSAEVRDDESLKLGPAEVLRGGREVEVPAPDEELPMFVRAGALLALLPADVQTLTDYGDDVVNLDDRRHRRTLLAWPRRGAPGRAEPGRGDSAVSTLEPDRWRLRIRSSTPRRYDVQAVLADPPCEVSLDGRPLDEDEWRYEDDVLRLSVRLRSGELVARLEC